jgi:hypothetical protein
VVDGRFPRPSLRVAMTPHLADLVQPKVIMGDRALDFFPLSPVHHLLDEMPNTVALVEREALVRAFSPGSTLEWGLKWFHRRGH